MPVDCIPFRETNYFSTLICDYIDKKESLKSFYGNYPSLENFSNQIDQKKHSFSLSHRTILVQELKEQYRALEIKDIVAENIDSLKDENTFTITTGHQLNLFTGPLYFLYKIISTINLCKKLKEQYPGNNFVPIYWMATEDHDFDEIHFFNLYGKKIQWNRDAKGPVGRLSTEGLDKVFDIFSAEIGVGKNADELRDLFRNSYLKSKSLAEATRHLANELFGDQGLVIVDGDSRNLKRLFIPYMEQELKQEVTYKYVLPATDKLNDLNYNVQVNPREINLFYITDNLRERIIKNEDKYYVNDTDIAWSEAEIIKRLDAEPESFSPNVMMRPLYQEVILPNLCYIGGGGELAYWFELQNLFKEVEVPFPILLLRNSVLLKSKKQQDKIEKLNISTKDLFLKKHELINKKVRNISNIDIDFSPQRKHLMKQFEDLYKLAEVTDASFINAVKAQEVKQLKGLDMLEKRLLKAQRIKLSDHVARLTKLQNELFPNGSLQERNKNFSEFYKEYGKELIDILITELDALKNEFVILTMN